MKSFNVYAANAGWIYEVRVESRVVVVGWCATREEAGRVAFMA